MFKRLYILFFFAFIAACSRSDQFAEYQREFMGEVPIGESVSKQITIQNPSTSEIQHIAGLNFDTGHNSAGHFQIEKVEVGGAPANPRDKDITIPAGSILEITVKYRPMNMETTVATLGGWTTGEEERYVPEAPKDEEEGSSATKAMKALIGKAETNEKKEEKAIHRAILAVVYDKPAIGVIQVELVGEAVVGPDGQRTAGGGSMGQCPSDSGIICYQGGFAMELPDIMSTGPAPLKMTGPVVFGLAGTSVSLDMGAFPAALLVLKGNGPGEPLEGLPISAISLVVSGPEGVTATGTFDGTNLEVNGVAFRIRVVLGEISEKDITPGLQAAVDFNVKDLQIKTSKPYTNGSIILSVDAVLPDAPSGNPSFDQMLGNIKVNVTMDGSLKIQ